MKLQQYFSVQGFSAEGFSFLSDLGKAMQKLLPDILIMELDFSDGDGFQFLRKAHARYPVPIIIASQRESESDRIMSFELGCDDFVSKPYSMKELTLRIIAILKRRNASGYSMRRAVYRVRTQELVVDWDSHMINLDGNDITLTTSEWKIITYLAANAGSLVSRSLLLPSAFPKALKALTGSSIRT